MTKRIFDVIASAIGLVVLSPLMAVIAVFVKRDSAGPALFKQERIGLYGEPFTLLKFRSMTQATHVVGPQVTAAGDPRITEVGRRLRSSKLDELPQLLNVLRGDMSIVGPRPEVAKYVDLWPEDDRVTILSVRPGITDPMTVQLRREEEVLASQPDPESYYVNHLLPLKTQAYVEYARNYSAFNDMKILAATIKEIVRR